MNIALTTAACVAITMSAISADAQGIRRAPKLDIGADAPQLDAMAWLRGDEIDGYSEGEAYVVDFWATWCGPCIRSMPHLTDVQEKYEDKGLTVVAVNIDSLGNTGKVTPAIEEKVRNFVANNEDKMGFTVMMDNQGTTDRAIRQAAGFDSIPLSVIVDQKGRVAWLGHPQKPDFDSVVAEVVAGTYDVEKVVEAKNLAQEAIADFRSGKREEAFTKIDKIVDLNPVPHARLIVDRLQLTVQDGDPQEALDYATNLMENAFKDDATSLTRITAVLNRWGTPEALELSLKAGERAMTLNTEGSAGPIIYHAETFAKLENFEEAISLLETARAVTKSQNAIDEIDRRLALYRAGETG